MTEVNATRMIKFIEQARESAHLHGTDKPSYSDTLIDAVAAALKDNPYLNAVWGENGITISSEVNIGLAVAIDGGVIVPVVRNASYLDFGEIVRQRTDLVDRARARQLQLGETSGATFTISNLGMFDIDCFTAIINPPQAAILSVGRIKETAVVRGQAIAIAPIMKLVLGVDHRVTDGATAAAFLQDVKRRVESYGVGAEAPSAQ
jgi:pyruvate dehydrogenase E2 component (dihydrolipoamide acetyltransferase)